MRTCRNCGLPIASDSDPLRGVAPGSVDLPKVRRSGLSATVGFVLVIGLIIVGGTLAVSGGGILGSGGRFVTGPGVTASAAPLGSGDPGSGEVIGPLGSGDPGNANTDTPTATGTSFEYTCDDDAIKDLSKGKWFLSEVQAGVRSDEDGAFDQVYWKMTRQSQKNVKKATTVTMEWTTPKEAQEKYGIPRVLGNRAIVVTFNGPVDITANQTIESYQLEAADIEQVKKIQLFESGGKVRTVIGLRSDSCARMEAKGWGGKAKPKAARVILDIERIATAQ